MKNLAIIAPIDFYSLLSTEKERNIGGTASVIRSILPYIECKSIILYGITHNRKKLYNENSISSNIKFIPVIYIPRNNIIPSRIHVFIKSKRINKYFKNYNVDVVYSHSLEMSFWINKKYPFLQHMHGAANAIIRSRFNFLRIPLLISLWSYIRKKVLQNAVQVVAIDDDCYSIAINYLKKENVYLIANFVDTSMFYDDNEFSTFTSNFSKNKIALFVGRIEEIKGLELFVDVIEQLNQIDKSWIGIIAGKGSYEKKLRQYISRKKNIVPICFLGAIYNQNELRKLYSQAEIFLITSYHEGIPMTILESLACKTPVIATNVGGIKNLGVNGIPCFVVDGRDPKLFIDRIIKIINDNKVRNFAFPYSAKMISKEINKILTDLINKKKIFCPIPLPPPYYGSNISNKNIISSSCLNKKFDFDILPISYNNKTENVGRISIKKFLLIIKIFFLILFKSLKNYDLVYYVPAVKGVAFIRDFILLLPLKLSQANILVHLRGKGILENSRKNILLKLLYKIFFHNTSVICLSERLTYDIKTVFKGDIFIINNAIKTENYPIIRKENKIPIILFLSNFIESKGILVLLEAANILKSQNINFQLDLSGAARGNIMGKINKLINKYNLSSNIISVGPKYGLQKKQAFLNADIFVFPTFFEAWGLVNLEAMQAELPVISTNEGAIPDVVDDSETGFIVKKKDPVDLAEKIKILVLNKELRKEMGRKGKEKFNQKYTYEKYEKQITEVFLQAINKQ